MIKKGIFTLIFLNLLCSTLRAQSKINIFSGDKIELFSEIHYQAIPPVALTEYKSVQTRNTNIQNPKIALGIGISGGGSRAEFFSLGVLLELENLKSQKTKHNVLTEIDYFSTVSGGCFSAGYYLTLLKNKLLPDESSFYDFYFSQSNIYKSEVNKTANAFSLLNNKKNEKGEKISMTQRLDLEVLQYDITNPENSSKFNSQMLLSDFFIPKNSPKNQTLPILVANAAAYNNGERFPFMPHILKSMWINASLAPNVAAIPLTEEGYNDGYLFPLTYAITASSAFPGVLPKVKFGIKDQEKILCLIDGGAAENMGYKTLIELLSCDLQVNNHNKRAIFIDCLGEGKKSAFIADQKINLFNLLETATLYTVLTKYITFDKDVELELEKSGIPTSNYTTIGFGTIRDYLNSLNKNEEYNQFVTQLRNTPNTESNWQKLYESFKLRLINDFGLKSFRTNRNNQVMLASLENNKFPALSSTQILLLYEYASQIQTKLKITDEEEQMLLLAGRFATFIKSKKLLEFLEEH
ncbi:patatin-like phospholipase family protein [Flavobacterium agrisoli]|uniref:Patatin-like phospholipase family protein n=1 Tax=Flavobacterium agrisoli TaxID=2793066 RepID=A0A934PKU9_9FLAO|nr:patatin-like phospholipase family protein [Flavobacterium agrisoli]MBK0369457.1 patatin-like phospholipase family protein [Flavobacterium agrisoli]